MKIAVLTLPLVNNYGGNLQAFAMMRLLKNLGYEPVFLNLKLNKTEFLIRYIIKKYFLWFIPRYKNPILLKQTPFSVQFIDKYINPKTKEIYTSKDLYYIMNNGDFDACIVGSDQVFRTLSVSKMLNNIYSLSGVNDKIIKLSYAASFGADRYLGGNIEFHSKNFKKFKAISVREKSGIKICKETFGIDAVHVLDPTMMLEVDEYKNI
ncbi:MAG: polysaccharide pyruvyl transferase family protein, partial [Campylobacter sputorum]|uniref:polysaccharide pyruvyl transferase family protein n=1 Tax=Campylobacter sputorum TaxID=206 RepID=UPI002A90E61B